MFPVLPQTREKDFWPKCRYRREDNVAQKNYGATIDDDLAMQPQSKDCCCSSLVAD